MEDIRETINDFCHFNVIDSVIIIIISLILYKLVYNIFFKNLKKKKLDNKFNRKGKTYLRLITSILRYIFLIITALILLQVNGVNVSSMLAGVGITSVIIGLAIQDALKDIIRGIDILSDEYFNVGDVIYYNGLTGNVISLGLKSTKIKEVATGNTITIANRNIEQVELVSPNIYINIPLPYELKVADAENVIKEMLQKADAQPDIESSRYLGVNAFAESSMNYLIEVNCMPSKKLQVRRDTLGIIIKTLEEHRISIPYQQIVIENHDKH